KLIVLLLSTESTTDLVELAFTRPPRFTDEHIVAVQLVQITGDCVQALVFLAGAAKGLSVLEDGAAAVILAEPPVSGSVLVLLQSALLIDLVELYSLLDDVVLSHYFSSSYE